MELIIGNKNYSSWSLRGWLVLKAFGINFSEHKLKLFTEEFYSEVSKVSGAGKVPVLIDGEHCIWDSLAICEYVNEQYLEGRGWPETVSARAEARSISCEMHSGFMALRDELPMNCRAKRSVELSESAQKDIARIKSIWGTLRERYSAKGPWLFGNFSIADVMYAPVVLRFKTYGIELDSVGQEYMQTVLAFPPLLEWLEGADEESDIVVEDEAGEEVK
ncbi:MAG: glutathione S-transferase family protein [Neptuniibacter sp.]